jgi:ubiquinone/menaquinone biosynthesis C-methylase UbiE/tetratricopeptide (TPR) repeat protein
MFQKDIWDNVWKNGKYSDWDNSSQLIYETLIEEIGDIDGKKILEAGSGTGRISLRLAKDGADVTLVDFSEIAIEQAKERFESEGIFGSFYVADIMNMKDIPDSSFDVIWNAGVLEHFDYEQQIVVLQEMKRVLKPDGLLITINPNAKCLPYQVGKWFLEKTNRWPYGQELPIFTLSPLAEPCQLRLLKEYSIGFEESFYFYNFVPDSTMAVNALEKWYNSLPPEKKEEVEGYLLVSVFQYEECKSIQKDETTKKNWAAIREMEEGKTVIFLSSVRYREDLWQRPQQLAKQFVGLGYRVIYVNPQTLILNSSEKVYEGMQINAELLWKYFLQAKQDEGVYVVNRIDLIEDLQGNRIRVLDQFLKHFFTFFASKHTKVVTYLPEYASVLSQLKEELQFELYYDCVDEMTGFHTSKKVIADEQQLLTICDGVSVTSKTLFVHKGKDIDRCALIPNGVNYKEYQREVSIPAELVGLTGPIIGYVGAIAHWFDQDLLCEVAKKYPQWNFVLIGTVYVDVSRMKNLDNVYILGRKEQWELPDYTRHFDVGIIPFVMNDLIVNTNPIKYYEYLAAGLRTVSVAMPELVNEPYCTLATNAEDFGQYIENALKEGKVQPDLAYLETNSWRARAIALKNFMEQEDKKKEAYYQTLRNFVNLYFPYVQNIPLIAILSAEIHQVLGETDKAKDLVREHAANMYHVCSAIQTKLAIVWGDKDRLIECLRAMENCEVYDIYFWEQQGNSALQVYALRKTGQLQEALELAQRNINNSPVILEEIGNLYFDIKQYDKAAESFAQVYQSNLRLFTVEGSHNFAKIAEKLGEHGLANYLIQNSPQR